MKDGHKTIRHSKYLVAMIVFVLMVILTLGYLLVRQAKNSIISLMHTRMLDISNTAAAMIDGDVLRTISPEDEGTEDYDAVMRTLTYFQDNIDLKYIYCIRDMGDGTFTFGLDPTIEDPGEFGSPIVYTDALYRASQGMPSADDRFYEDAWGKFYSAYSPVFDSAGKVAGIIAVDFSAEWYDAQLRNLSLTTFIVALIFLLAGGVIVMTIVTRSERKIETIHGQLNEMASTLMHEMGKESESEEAAGEHPAAEDTLSMDDLGKQIQSMQTELKTQIAQVHVQAYRDGLTGVKSRHAYLETEKELDHKLAEGQLKELGVVVCDVNGLKKINDTLGHKAGDDYIRRACELICGIFAHSPVYRIGGDEFTVLLTGKDYENRKSLIHELHRCSSANIVTGGAIVSGGMAEYQPETDQRIRDVFERADANMYQEKMLLKSLGAETRAEENGKGLTDPEELPLINVRKHILIADDIAENREILGDLLEDDFDILYAADGIETLEMLRSHKDEIALLILDLYMPNMSGREVMREMQTDEELMGVPIMVMTVDQDAELDCLKIGAMDFIPKPYPNIEIVKARISKCIELSENRDLIRHTQRDRLTGLFHIEYFLRYVNLFDQQNKDTEFDALVCDVNAFYKINEQYGRQFGDLVLRSIGSAFRTLARKTGGIGCRESGDTFLLYCPHREDYETLLAKFVNDLSQEKEIANKVTLRFGVFPDARREPEIEERFACAKAAASGVEKEIGKLCGYYEYRSI